MSMTPYQLFIETDDISDSVIGTRVELRAREVVRWRNGQACGSHVWVAYTVSTGGSGGLRKLRSLKDTRGRRVESFVGKGDLIEHINALIAKRQLAL